MKAMFNVLLIFFFAMSCIAQDTVISVGFSPQIINRQTQTFLWEEENGSFYLIFDTPQHLIIQAVEQDYRRLPIRLIGKNTIFSKSSLQSIQRTDEGLAFLFARPEKGQYQITYFDNQFQIIKQSPHLHVDRRELIGSVWAGGKWVILTVKRKSSIIISYTFDLKGGIQKHAYDFNGIDYESRFGRLSSLLIKNFDTNTNELVPNIQSVKGDRFQLQSFNKTYPKKKLYAHQDHIFFTFDHFKDSTILLWINTSDHNSAIRVVNKPEIDKKKASLWDTNSVMYRHFLIQGSVSDRELAIRITDIFSRETIQEYRASVGNIPFQDSHGFFQTHFSNIIPTPYHLRFAYIKGKQGNWDSQNKMFKRPEDAWFCLAVNERQDKSLELKIGYYLSTIGEPEALEGYSKWYFLTQLEAESFSRSPNPDVHEGINEFLISLHDQIIHTYYSFYIKLFPTTTRSRNSLNNVLIKREVGREYLLGYYAYDQRQFILLSYPY